MEMRFLLKLVKRLGVVKVTYTDKGDSMEAILLNLKEGFEEMKQINEGSKKGTPLQAFLDEL